MEEDVRQTPPAFSQAFSIDANLSAAWRALKAAPFPLFVGGSIMAVTNCNGRSLRQYQSFAGGAHAALDADPFGDLPALSVLDADGSASELLFGGGAPWLYLSVFLIGLALRSWLHTGYIRLHKEAIVAKRGSFGTLFSGVDRFFDMAAYKVVAFCVFAGAVLIASMPGFLLMYPLSSIMSDQPWDPGGHQLALGALLLASLVFPTWIYVKLGLAFGERALVLEGRKPTDALKRSWNLARGYRLHLFWFQLVMKLAFVCVTLMGVLAFFVGVLVSGPIAHVLVRASLTRGFLTYTGGGLDDQAGPPEPSASDVVPSNSLADGPYRPPRNI